jgi:heme A synthase
MIAPIIFGVLVVLVASGYVAVILLFPVPLVVKILAGLVIVALGAAMAYVLVQRNREMKEEDKIDLSKY